MNMNEEKWWGDLITIACEEITKESCGVYKGPIFRDKFEEFAAAISKEARRLAIEECRKVVELALKDHGNLCDEFRSDGECDCPNDVQVILSRLNHLLTPSKEE